MQDFSVTDIKREFLLFFLFLFFSLSFVVFLLALEHVMSKYYTFKNINDRWQQCIIFKFNRKISIIILIDWNGIFFFTLCRICKVVAAKSLNKTVDLLMWQRQDDMIQAWWYVLINHTMKRVKATLEETIGQCQHTLTGANFNLFAIMNLWKMQNKFLFIYIFI